MLSATDLQIMRAARAGLLPDTCQIQRPARAGDGQGGWSDTWATVATVACAVAPDTEDPEPEAVADRLAAVVKWFVTLPALTDARAGDRVLTGGRTFTVVSPYAPRSRELSRRCQCLEVTA